jgi:lysophospholipase L1-like esterase
MTILGLWGAAVSAGAGSSVGRRRRLRRSLTVGVLIAGGTAVVTVGGGAEATAAAGWVPTSLLSKSYVALGDSFTSGPAVPVQLGPNTDPSAPKACLRSSDNYPSLAARALGLVLTDESCGGATSGDLTRTQGPGIPAQLSAISGSTSLVSIGIGGNDLGFSTIAVNCVAATPWGPTRVGWSCKSHYTAGGMDQLAAEIHEVGSRVSSVLEEIRARSRHAKVFVVGYPDIVPPTGSGCWPRLPFSAQDLGYLRGVEEDLNATLAKDAEAADDVYVDMATPSAPHNACSSEDTRWVESIVPSPTGYPLHPSAAGMAGMAQVLEGALRSTGGGGGNRMVPTG